jgi:tyrosine decarboxylase/aspartate 1-decarboxylase
MTTIMCYKYHSPPTFALENIRPNMKYWKKLSHAEQDARITKALQGNIDYTTRLCLGIPASRLDPQVFYDQASFLKDAPLLRAYVQNPNHIGCHTMGESEVFFRGTQELEKEVIALLSTDLLKAEDDSCDGYIASGGTEANIQAAWIYRNEFIQKYQATHEEIALIGSEDTHYSIAKAANLLHLKWYKTSVDFHTREIIPEALDAKLAQAQKDGIKYCIVIANKGTTMFGSIDDPDVYVTALQKVGMAFRIHVDGAFGGFMVPPTDTTSKADFSHPHVSSITLDAHKMLQAPYGTGIFIARKGLMEYTCTREAQYVHGMDNTLSGSRSGANAIAVWMILFTYGPFGWLEKINKLIYRTKWCCKELDQLNVRYYNRPGMNIITIQAEDLPATLADAYGLVPDAHEGKANWYKIVIMDHVEMEHLQALIHDIKALKKG